MPHHLIGPYCPAPNVVSFLTKAIQASVYTIYGLRGNAMRRDKEVYHEPD